MPNRERFVGTVACAVLAATAVPVLGSETSGVSFRMSDGTAGSYVEPVRRGPAYVETYGAVGFAGAGPTFNVEYLDVTNDTNIGFDDPVTGAIARETVGAVLAYISTVITDTGSADIQFNESQTDGTGALGSAGPFFFQSDCVDPFTLIHITTGVDPFGGVPDGTATIDFGWNWNLDQGPPVSGENDFFSVVLHELTHALGFLSSLRSSCAPACCEPVAGADNRFDGFDRLLEQGSTSVALIDCDAGQYLGGDLTGGLGGVVLNGSAVNVAWADLGGTGSPPVFTPGSFQCGASVGHWDDADPTIPATAVMRSSILIGSERRVYQPLDSALLSDIGYTIAAAPATCLADLNGDDNVGFADLSTLLESWGPCAGCAADLTGDDVVGFADLNDLLAAWGPCTST